METTNPPIEKKSETVSEPKPKKTRKFTWTPKRKAQFEKMMSANREKLKEKKSKKHEEVKPNEKEVEEKEITQESVEELENQKTAEKEEKQSKNIVKRIMDPHFLSRKDRHLAGTTPESTSESSSDSSDNESDSSESESSIEKKKKPLKKPKTVKKNWKVERKLEKLRMKNKQLQYLVLSKKKKNQKKHFVDPLSSDESEEEPIYSQREPPILNNPIYFC